jgi:hypothetical protein
LPGSITHVSNVGYWTITNGGTGGTSAVVTLYYNIDDEVTDESFLRIAKDDGSGNWIDLGGTGSAPFAGNITSTNNFTAFSAFALGNGLGGANPLPVEWLSFTGEQQEDLVLLTWQTAAEKDNDYFTVERSANGTDFTELGEIPGSGTTHQVSTYQFADEQPLIGIGYYRIRQTDYDGKTDFSRIIAVDFDPFKDPARKDSDTLVYPNPVIGESVRLVVNNRYNIQEMEISILDATGRIYLVRPILLSDNILDLNLERSQMAPGLYTIRITSPAAVYSAKMVVQ